VNLFGARCLSSGRPAIMDGTDEGMKSVFCIIHPGPASTFAA